MNIVKLAAGIGTAWLAILVGPTQARDGWEPQNKAPSIVSQHTGGTNKTTILLANFYNWYRSVQAWQSFKSPGDIPLSGISLQLQYAKVSGNKASTIDINVYEGVGVEGRLIASNKVEWTQPLGEGWYGFRLNTLDMLERPLILKKDAVYTFSLENILPEDSLGIIVDSGGHQPSSDTYMQQGYFGMDAGPRGYTVGSHAATINYILWQ